MALRSKIKLTPKRTTLSCRLTGLTVLAKQLEKRPGLVIVGDRIALSAEINTPVFRLHAPVGHTTARDPNTPLPYCD
jgi:hypothetical protein